ncbi:hypothetical protein V8E53_001838 [Lactarius tabidus]
MTLSPRVSPAAVSIHDKMDPLMPSDPPNSPSTPPDPILDDILPAGTSAPSASLVLTPSGPDPGTPSEDCGGPIPILRQENEAPDPPSVVHHRDQMLDRQEIVLRIFRITSMIWSDTSPEPLRLNVENDGTSYTVVTDDGHTNHESREMLRCLRPSPWTSSLRWAERNDESEPGAPPRRPSSTSRYEQEGQETSDAETNFIADIAVAKVSEGPSPFVSGKRTTIGLNI